MRKKKRIRWYHISGILLVILGILALGGYLINPYRGTISWSKMVEPLSYDQVLTKDQAVEDLKYMMNQIKAKHYRTLKGVEPQLNEIYQEELANLPEAPTVTQLWAAGSRILKELKDGHSQIYYEMGENSYLPLKLIYENERIICNEGERAGQEIIAIGGVDIYTLHQRFLSQFSYENDFYGDYQFPKHLTAQSDLTWLGLDCSQGVSIVFQTGSEIETAQYTFVKAESTELSGEEETKDVSFTLLENEGIGLLTIDQCTYDRYYKETLKTFFEKVKQEKIKTVVVDLTHNGGGNSQVVDEFIRYLPVESYNGYGSKTRLLFWSLDFKPSKKENKPYEDLTFDGKLWVATSNQTFSSATMFAVVIRDNQLGEIIGEPSGNKPSAYGDVLTYQLPNSRLPFVLTYKEFSRPDISKDQEEALMPDYPCDPADILETVKNIL